MSDHFAGRVFWRPDTEEDLHWPRVVLIEPAFQTVPGLGVHAFERLEHSDRRRVTRMGNAPVERETQRDDKLPQHDAETEKREHSQNDVQSHARFLKGVAVRGKRLLLVCEQKNSRTMPEEMRARLL